MVPCRQSPSRSLVTLDGIDCRNSGKAQRKVGLAPGTCVLFWLKIQAVNVNMMVDLVGDCVRMSFTESFEELK